MKRLLDSNTAAAFLGALIAAAMIYGVVIYMGPPMIASIGGRW